VDDVDTVFELDTDSGKAFDGGFEELGSLDELSSFLLVSGWLSS